MSLQEILFDATIGFTCGLAWGLNEPIRKGLNVFEYYEMLGTDVKEFQESFKEIEEKLSVNIEPIEIAEIESIRNKINVGKNLLTMAPLAIAGAYSVIENFVTRGELVDLSENLLVSTPFCYLGSFIGRGLKAFKYRENRQQLDTLKKAVMDKDNLGSYLLTDSQMKVVEESLIELETVTLEGRRIDHHSPKSPTYKMHKTIMDSPKPYQPFLIHWSVREAGKRARICSMQKDLSDFFEVNIPEPLKKVGMGSLCIVGEPRFPKVMAYSKEEDELVIESYEWPNVRIIVNDNSGCGVVENARAEVSEVFRGGFPNEYRDLANRVISDQNEHSIVLMQRSSQVPQSIFEKLVTGSFLPQYHEYLMSRHEEV
ncbi:hypothetical protein GOV12_01895 [Candidatus Pacearchaeota archaeon]|nr:hypothetical protein [Candidatus Pacearchaeota archaeon]